jgi:ATP-dependent DNA helicase RecG
MHDPSNHTLDAPQLTLGTAIQFAPGVGPRRAELFERLDVRTVAELIKHLPHRYERHAGEAPIAQLPIDMVATARGTVISCRFVPGRGARHHQFHGVRNQGRFVAAVQDDTGRLDVVWFNAPYLRDKLHPGMTVTLTGKVVLYDGHRQMVNPRMQIIGEAEHVELAPAGSNDPPPAALQEKLRPIYPATEDLPSGAIERVIEAVLPLALPQIEDHFDADFRTERALPELREAYRMLHAPAHEDEVKSARRRLAYDELLLLQLGFAVKKKHTHTELQAPALRYSEAIDKHIRERFPFPLTDAQSHVVGQIANDLQRTIPMNRLLQGDVGSGKTVVALYAMLMAVAAGKQAALMAPTELLAEQHFLSISRMLAGSTVRLALLTGSLSKPERTQLLYRIEKGDVDLVIGTQALISDHVAFSELAVVVVDEQHRFGVLQRASIKSKAGDEKTVPHTLVMTATPIPRTLSLSIFGDLDVSTITALPPGRQPITTKVVTEDKCPDVYGYLARRIEAGEQAYIVLPAIDETAAGLKAVRSHAKELEETYLKGKRIGMVHGQLKQTAREKIMHKFRAGELDVLIATTVIEVGVDVPNASIMVVEHAERFGLAQLHQLRGRVGRGTRKSLCVFVADPTTEDGQQRMAAIAKTTDGFEIAEADLMIRGMGEFFGTRQSGLPPLKVAALPEHLDLLKLARRDAIAIVDADAKLQSPRFDLLRKRLIKAYGEAIGLADVA